MSSAAGEDDDDRDGVAYWCYSCDQAFLLDPGSALSNWPTCPVCNDGFVVEGSFVGSPPQENQMDDDRHGQGGRAVLVPMEDRLFEALVEMLDSEGDIGGPSPARASAIEAMPRVQIVPGQLSEVGSQCPVCKDDFVAGEEARQMVPCGHLYHGACIVPWLSRHNSCPVCRQKLSRRPRSRGLRRRRRMDQVNSLPTPDNIVTGADVERRLFSGRSGDDVWEQHRRRRRRFCCPCFFYRRSQTA